MKELNSQELQYREVNSKTLHNATLFMRKFEKASADLGCEHIIFTFTNGQKQDTDLTTYLVAKGMAEGAWNILSHEGESKDIANMIVEIVNEIPKEDLPLHNFI